MKENSFQKKVVNKLKEQGAWILNIHGHKWQKSGVPDLLVIHRDWKGFLELKVENNKVSSLQKVIATKIIKRLFPCYVLRCKEVMIGQKIFDAGHVVTIEDFNGNIVDRPAELSKVLACLIDLKGDKYFHISKDYINNTKVGDSIYVGDGEFMRID